MLPSLASSLRGRICPPPLHKVLLRRRKTQEAAALIEKELVNDSDVLTSTFKSRGQIHPMPSNSPRAGSSGWQRLQPFCLSSSRPWQTLCVSADASGASLIKGQCSQEEAWEVGEDVELDPRLQAPDQILLQFLLTPIRPLI